MESYFINYIKKPLNSLSFYEIKDEINIHKDAYGAIKLKVSDDFFNSASSLFIYHSILINSNNDKVKQITSRKINQEIYDLQTNHTTSNNNSQMDEQKMFIRNHFSVLKDAYEKRKQPLSIDQILEWHLKLSTGLYRYTDFRKVNSNSDHFIFTEPNEIRNKLSNLVRIFNSTHKDYEANKKVPIFSVAAWFMHNFSCIHPFENLNGIMTLLLTNFVLFSFDYPFPIPFYMTKDQLLSEFRFADNNLHQKNNLTNFLILNSIKIFKNYKYLYN